MKSFDYKDYWITLSPTNEGVLATALHDNNDFFRIHYIDYSMADIVKRVKEQCRYRIKNNFPAFN
jgi:hypothetical protein